MNNLNLEKLYEERFNPEEEYLGRDKEVNKIEPLVSVCTATYQHAEYIEECIKGILIQKTDFPFELIIGEDESDDGTREICKKYAREYPDKIRLFLRDRKTSCIFNDKGERINGFNGKWARKSARGKYIAMCEGDDYWTDPLKLQKQVDFIEKNERFVLVVGGFKQLNSKTGEANDIIRKVNKLNLSDGYSFTKYDLTKGWITKMLTALFKREALNDFSLNKFKNAHDVHLFYHLLQKGDGFYLTEVLGVYRVHSGGVFSSKQSKKKIIDSYQTYKDLYKVYKDEPARFLYLHSLKMLFSSKIITLKTDNYIKRVKEALKLTNSFREILLVLISLIPVLHNFVYKFRVK